MPAELGWRLGSGVSPAWEPGIFTLAGPAAPLPGPNPLLLLCFPLPPRHDPASHFTRRRGTSGGNFLPPTQPQTELHLHVLPAGCGGVGGGGAASRPPLLWLPPPAPSSVSCSPTQAPPLPSIHEVPYGALPSEHLQREPRTPSPASSTSDSVSSPALPGMATESTQCLLRAGQHWASPRCRAEVG